MPDFGDVSGALSQGIQNGTQYAVQAADLGFRKQLVDSQLQNAQSMKEDHDFAINQKMFDGYVDYYNEPDPKIADIKFKKFQADGLTMGRPIDPTWKEVAKSDAYKEPLDTLISNITQLPKDQARPVLNAAISGMGSQAVIKTLLSDAQSTKLLVQKNQQQTAENEKNRQSQKDIADAHNKAMIEASKQRANGQAVTVKSDNLLNRVGDKFDKAPNMSKLVDIHGRLAEGLNILNRPNVSVTEMKDVLSGVVNAINRNPVTTDAVRKDFSMSTLDSKVKEAEAFVASDPNQAATPASLDFLKKLGGRVLTTYDQQIGNEAKRVHSGLQYGTKAANDLKDAKLKYYNGDYQNEVRSSNGLSPYDPKGLSGTLAADIQKAGRAKQIYDKMPSGPAKDAALVKIKAAISEDARKKVGLP